MQRFALGLLCMVPIWVSAVAVEAPQYRGGDLELLGRGAIANVYLAKEKGSDQDVAI